MRIGQTASDLSGSEIRQTLFAKLSWSHYERLIRVEQEEARNWYLNEASERLCRVRVMFRKGKNSQALLEE